MWDSGSLKAETTRKGGANLCNLCLHFLETEKRKLGVLCEFRMDRRQYMEDWTNYPL